MQKKIKSENPILTICIVSWNIVEKLLACLRSIYVYKDCSDIEIIVVDNASTDNTVEVISAAFPDVHVKKLKKNIGFGRATNYGLRTARGTYFLSLNPDIILLQPCFSKMIRVLDRDENVALVTCRLLGDDKAELKTIHFTFPKPYTELHQAMLIHRLKSLLKEGQRRKSKIAWVVGACLLLRTIDMKKLGGFDDRFFMYGEDVDLCFRLKKAGRKIHFEESIVMMHHHGGSSSKKEPYFSMLMQRESRVRFMNKHYGTKTAVLTRTVWLVGSTIRIFIYCIIFPLSLSLKYRLNYCNGFRCYFEVFKWSVGYVGTIKCIEK